MFIYRRDTRSRDKFDCVPNSISSAAHGSYQSELQRFEIQTIISQIIIYLFFLEKSGLTTALFSHFHIWPYHIGLFASVFDYFARGASLFVATVVYSS